MLRSEFKPQIKKVIATYDIDFIFKKIKEGRSINAKYIQLEGHKVKICSTRLMTFYNKGTECIKCNCKATEFRLEFNNNCHAISPHLGLYHVSDDETMLFTKDHIIPKSKGGPDTLDNMQTMCCFCNFEKGNTEE